MLTNINISGPATTNLRLCQGSRHNIVPNGTVNHNSALRFSVRTIFYSRFTFHSSRSPTLTSFLFVTAFQDSGDRL